MQAATAGPVAAPASGAYSAGPTAAGRPETGTAGGPCERQLSHAAARYAPLLRAGVVGLAGTFGLAAYDVGAALVVVAVLVVATVLPCVQSRRHATASEASEASEAFLVGTAVLTAVTGLSQLVLGATPTNGWIVASASITSATCYFEWPHRPLAAHGIAAVTILAYGTGCLLAGGGVPVETGIRLVLQASLASLGLMAVRRVARLCDGLVRRDAERRVAAAAERAKRSADRAYLAMLHDTASTTLLMVSTNATGNLDWLREQARRDIETLTGRAPVDRDIDLADLLESMSSFPGLTVRVEIRRPLALPARPALAIYLGVREALRNVRQHTNDPSPTLSAHQRAGRVVVLLSDHGDGFDPDAVPAHRRGLSQSIRARMTDAGGQVDVRSTPGHGTAIRWTWSRG